MRKLLRGYGFLAALLGVIVAAALVPELGGRGGLLGSALLAKAGIAAIFFNLGLSMRSERLPDDLRDWRLHLACQSIIFLLLPLSMTAASPFLSGMLPPSALLGLLYLSALPTTISTAIVFTMNAGGNSAAAVFNCSVANLAALALTPLWMQWHLARTPGPGGDMGAALLNTALLLLLPLAVGQLLRWALRGRLPVSQQTLGRVNNAIILFIVFQSFARSFTSPFWISMNPVVFVPIAAVTAGFLGFACLLAWYAARFVLRVPRADRITLFFCASQKSLAAGVALLVPVFAASGPLLDPALILLPLLLYHALQLALGGWLAPRWKISDSHPSDFRLS